MASPVEEEMFRFANALNELGHVASGQSLVEVRQQHGDHKLKEMLQEAVKTSLGVIQREEKGPNPNVFPSASDAKAALSQMQNLLPSLDWDDAEAMAQIREHARQALEALGFGVPE